MTVLQVEEKSIEIPTKRYISPEKRDIIIERKIQ